MKPRLWYTLYKLAEHSPSNETVMVSTTELAKRMRVSQQTASRQLIELEREGFIERYTTSRGEQIKVTQRGIEELRAVYLGLKPIIEGIPSMMAFEGTLFSGMGEGAYYVSHRGYARQFVKKLGFKPYPGTLNLRLNSQKDIRLRKELGAYPAIIVEGFEDDARTFGPVRCYRALVDDAVEGAVILIDRTSYGETVVEVIAPVNLRELLRLRDGDRVRVKVFTAEANKP